MVRPSAFAVARLTTSSSLVGNSIGKSAGFSPFKNPAKISSVSQPCGDLSKDSERISAVDLLLRGELF